MPGKYKPKTAVIWRDSAQHLQELIDSKAWGDLRFNTAVNIALVKEPVSPQMSKPFTIVRTFVFTLFLSFFLLYIAPNVPKDSFVIYWGYIILFTAMSYFAAWFILRWGTNRK